LKNEKLEFCICSNAPASQSLPAGESDSSKAISPRIPQPALNHLSPVQALEVSLGTPALRFHPASKPVQAAISQPQASPRKRFMRVD
jgi:hypothetical protein